MQGNWCYRRGRALSCGESADTDVARSGFSVPWALTGRGGRRAARHGLETQRAGIAQSAAFARAAARGLRAGQCAGVAARVGAVLSPPICGLT